jgi:predicted small lipoprotein YifL
VNRNSNPSPRWAIILLAASVLALTGCGRKGPLDLPPTGSQSQSSETQSSVAPTDTQTQQAATPSVFNSTYGADAAPVAGKGPKKPFFLDPILKSN